MCSGLAEPSGQLPTGQDRTGRGRTGQEGATGLPLSDHGRQRNYSKNQAFCLLFPMTARVSCAKRYGCLFPCPFVQQKQKLIRVNVRSCRMKARAAGVGHRNFQELADYADKAHLGVVCLALNACFSVSRVKKPPLCGLLKHVSRPQEQKIVLLDS